MNWIGWLISVILWLGPSPNYLPGSSPDVAGRIIVDTLPGSRSVVQSPQTDMVVIKMKDTVGEDIRIVRVLITSATTRSYNGETRRLRSRTQAYKKTLRQIMSGNEYSVKRFLRLQNKILAPYQKMIEAKISGLKGVSVKFGPPLLGSWQGQLEPSFNMVLRIPKDSDTRALSNLLLDLAERTAQDAFILEENSTITNRIPLSEFMGDGYLHYPQIRVYFTGNLTVPEKAHIAGILHRHGLPDFSIGADHFFISILEFEGQQKEKSEKFNHIRFQISRAVRTIESQLDCEASGKPEILHRKSLYVEALNAGHNSEQSRTYARMDVFHPLDIKMDR